MGNLSEIKPQDRKRPILSDRGDSVKRRKLTELALFTKSPQLPSISIAPFSVGDKPKPENIQRNQEPDNANERPKPCSKKRDRNFPGIIQKDLEKPKMKKAILYGGRNRRNSRSFRPISECTTRSEGGNRFGNAKFCREHLTSEYPGTSEIERELETLGNSEKRTERVSVLVAVEENMGQSAGTDSNCSSQASPPRRNRFLREMRRMIRDSSSGNLCLRLPNVGPKNSSTWWMDCISKF